MKSILSVALLSLVGAATSSAVPRSCPESSQFGVLTVSPTTLQPGSTFAINTDFTCSVDQFSIVPKYLDYYIEVPENSNNGHEPPVLLARRQFSTSHGLTDSFTTTVPKLNYFEGAPYVVQVDVTYPIQGTDGEPVYIVGGTEASISLSA
ncbi:hypothetical protein SISSUDRAFT_1006312 [Sistotremastrum suecicum HHB10207 ss-3]|uniref:Uncharacterized protein n=1 Tax=Sistotremastrum suecicum HHB10207 ss-3 TaxID=1314776 RepID=A0A166CC03_9AGAM|nr:hypothetical protein SISSUDRAFT_1006312 [Sistotremastrum suecicum HHB10207 ss-3]